MARPHGRSIPEEIDTCDRIASQELRQPLMSLAPITGTARRDQIATRCVALAHPWLHMIHSEIDVLEDIAAVDAPVPIAHEDFRTSHSLPGQVPVKGSLVRVATERDSQTAALTSKPSRAWSDEYRRETQRRRLIRRSGPTSYTGMPSSPTVIRISVPRGMRTMSPSSSMTMLLDSPRITSGSSESRAFSE